MAPVNARILLWGIAGSGKTTTLQTIHDKLRPDLRGALRREPTRLDPTVHYETLPISLGEGGATDTRIELIAVPGAPEQAPTRKQLLDEVDGIVLVLDASPERIEANAEAIDELRAALAAYGRDLDSLPIVLQYNKRDVADPFAIEDLHRRIGLDQAAVFETIATTGHGVLATLTTISKHVVRVRRGSSQEITPPPASEADAASGGAEATPGEAEPLLEAEPLGDVGSDTSDLLEAAILAEGEEAADGFLGAGDDGGLSFEAVAPGVPAAPDAKPALGADLRIVSVGQARLAADGGVRLPLVLGDGHGASRSVVLTLRLDALLPDGDD